MFTPCVWLVSITGLEALVVCTTSRKDYDFISMQIIRFVGAIPGQSKLEPLYTPTLCLGLITLWNTHISADWLMYYVEAFADKVILYKSSDKEFPSMDWNY